MTDTGWLDASGEGEYDLGSEVQPTDILMKVISSTNPRIIQVGTLAPIRYRFAGGYGLADEQGWLGETGHFVLEWFAVDWALQHTVPSLPLVYARYLIWRLRTGLSI